MPHIDFPQSVCQAGVARRDITPPPGIYHRMWGAALHERATGVHRPLKATALVIGPSEGTGSLHALVSVDHCLLWNEDMEQLGSTVSSITGLPRAQIHIAFTHTHAAGLMDRGRSTLAGGELIGPYLDQMADRIAEAIVEARHELQPANIVYGTGRCSLACNRDFWDEATRQFVCGFNPAGASDDTLLVARIADESDVTLATVVNYACHPTTLAWDNTLVSPDYIGAMREVVERATGALCLFLQGASGDLGPRHGYVGDVAVADRNGRELGYAALAALEPLPEAGQRFEYAGPVVSGATLGTWAYRPLSEPELAAKQRFSCRQFAIDLPYRSDLPNRQQTDSERTRWQDVERAALDAGQLEAARDAHAQVERMTRQLARLRSLPDGPSVPVIVSIWQLGDALWVFLQGEYYSLLQRALRDRFADRPIIVSTVTDGWRPGYVPTAETYGRGIYQESIAIVAPGSLETLVERINAEIAAMIDG
jgi:hypothetical protein